MQPGQFQPPSYPPNNAPQQNRRGLWQWYRSKSRKTKLGIGCGVIIAILLFFSCIGAAIGSGTKTNTPSVTSPSPTPHNTQTNPTATQALVLATATPTMTPIPTATPTMLPTPTTPPKTELPVLGASLNAFIAKFGQPNDHSSSGMPHFERCGNSNTDQLILSQISIENVSGPITSVLVASCSSSWSTSQATAACSLYFPPDAKYQRSIQIPGNQGQFANVDKIYYSATLAHTFAADNFTDANQNMVQPGLFDVDYLYAGSDFNSPIDDCQILLGTQQTGG
jgi:hypothetical protein